MFAVVFLKHFSIGTWTVIGRVSSPQRFFIFNRNSPASDEHASLIVSFVLVFVFSI